MSLVKISGNASGTGTLTIAAPNTNSNYTLTIPTTTGTIITNADSGTVSQTMLATGVAGNGPAFSAYCNTSQGISANTITKIQLNTESFDTANCFDSTTNYRFTPTTAGYYQINATITYNAGTSNQQLYGYIYKNGSIYRKTYGAYTSVSGLGGLSLNDVIYFNGSTDYVELYTQASATLNLDNTTSNWMSGFLARSA